MLRFAERRAGRTARPDILAAQHQVVGNDDVDVEGNRVEGARWRRGSVGRSSFGRRPPPAAAPGCWPLESADLVASSALPLPSTVRSAETDLGQRLLRIRGVEQLEHPIDFDAGRVEPHVAHDLGPPDLAGDLQRRLDLDVAELVVQQLEVVGVDADVDAAEVPLVDRQLTRNAQLFAMVVEQLELLDLHAIRLQLDPRRQAGERAARRRHAERAILDVDKALEVRILSRAANVDIGFERAGDVRELGGESLDDRQVDGRRLHLEIDRVAGRRLDVPGSGARLEQRGRHACPSR